MNATHPNATPSLLGRIGTLWQSRRGKIGIGCAALFFVCAICVVCTGIYSLTPMYQQSKAARTSPAAAAQSNVSTVPAKTAPAANPTKPEPTARPVKPTVQVVALAATDQPTDTAAPTDVPTQKPTRVPPTVPAKPTVPPIPTKPPTSAPSFVAFGDGNQIVGTDIPAGTYRSQGSDGCYWARLTGFGGTIDEIAANDNAAGPAVVTIARTDKGFSSESCGTWTQDLSPITDSPNAPFGDGTFIVKKDIAPGTWRDSGGDCYWARLTGFSGTVDDIVANDNVTGTAIVTIGAGDAGFKSSGCGTWSKVQ